MTDETVKMVFSFYFLFFDGRVKRVKTRLRPRLRLVFKTGTRYTTTLAARPASLGRPYTSLYVTKEGNCVLIFHTARKATDRKE